MYPSSGQAVNVASDTYARVEAPFRAAEIRQRTPTIVELALQPLAEAMQYLPGEYRLLEDDRQRVPQRSYSIANAPRADGSISLLVTRVPGGQASHWIHERLRPGDEVIATGPYGTFVADPASCAPCLYLAGGSGLAPMRALLQASLASGSARSLTLIFSARTEADVLDGDVFARWQAEHAGFRFIRTLTRGVGAEPHGHIPDVLAKFCPDLSGHEVFIAGAPGLVRSSAIAADVLGAPRAHVHTEPFFTE
jgi:CDP-4-dehydro-6-deoxyglucose reductase, E3